MKTLVSRNESWMLIRGDFPDGLETDKGEHLCS
jgi:hypothetical protein